MEKYISNLMLQSMAKSRAEIQKAYRERKLLRREEHIMKVKANEE